MAKAGLFSVIAVCALLVLKCIRVLQCWDLLMVLWRPAAVGSHSMQVHLTSCGSACVHACVTGGRCEKGLGVRVVGVCSAAAWPSMCAPVIDQCSVSTFPLYF